MPATMPAMDVGSSSPTSVFERRATSSKSILDSRSILEAWGKAMSTSPSSAYATNSSRPDRCYLLLVEDKPVFVVVSNNGSEVATREPVLTQSAAVAQRLDLIKEGLRLSITQMAELFGVTRKSVYDWYEGKGQRSSTAARMEALIDVLDSVQPETDLGRLKAVWNIAISGRSFRDVFSDDELDAAALRAALNEKLNELSPRLVEAPRLVEKRAIPLGESQLAEYDRRADFG